MENKEHIESVYERMRLERKDPEAARVIHDLYHQLQDKESKLAAMESQEPALRINSMGGAMQWNPNYKGDWSGVFYAKPMPADKPAVAVPVFSESDLIEIASSYSAYAGSDTDLYLNAWINSGEAKGFIDLINDRSAPSHSQQSASVRKFDPCPICGTEKECMGGRSAHPSNWYCPNDRCPSHESEQSNWLVEEANKVKEQTKDWTEWRKDAAIKSDAYAINQQTEGE